MAAYRISELAERTGFSASTLRFYEQAGLLPDTARTPGGYRAYDDRAVGRLRFIARGKQLGLPLDKIRDLATLWDSGSCAPVQDRLATLLTDKIVEVRGQVEELTAFGDQLQAARDGLGAYTPDGCCDDMCGCLSPVGSVTPAPQVVPLLRTRPGLSTPRVSARVDVRFACTLTGPQQRVRTKAWEQLLGEATDRECTPDGVRLAFPADAGLAGRLASLAAQEGQCCRFLDLSIDLSGDPMVLRIRGPRAATDLVQTRFGSQL